VTDQDHARAGLALAAVLAVAAVLVGLVLAVVDLRDRVDRLEMLQEPAQSAPLAPGAAIGSRPWPDDCRGPGEPCTTQKPLSIVASAVGPPAGAASAQRWDTTAPGGGRRTLHGGIRRRASW
jgi:hypothetical protein